MKRQYSTVSLFCFDSILLHIGFYIKPMFNLKPSVLVHPIKYASQFLYLQTEQYVIYNTAYISFRKVKKGKKMKREFLTEY